MSIEKSLERLERWGFPSKAIGNKGLGELGEAKMVLLFRVHLLNTKLLGIYLHYHINPDIEREPHNHPWSFITICLKGGYEEKIYSLSTYSRRLYLKRIEIISKGDMRRRKYEHIHRVVEIKPGTVTLILRGPKKDRTWGFFNQARFIPSSYYDPNRRRSCLYGIPSYTLSCADTRCREYCRLLRGDIERC